MTPARETPPRSRHRAQRGAAAQGVPRSEAVPSSWSAGSPSSREQEALFDFVLALGDDSLVLGQRLSEWCGNAPFLEEDLALANVALDTIGRADLFYRYAAEIEGGIRSADQLAFLRDSREYRNLLICELPVGDFACTIARQVMVDTFSLPYLERLRRSADLRIAAIAAKAVKESRYHLERSREWVLRLGGGTDESHGRMQRAFDALWGYSPEMFEMTGAEEALLASGISVDRPALKADWENQVTGLLAEATLKAPQADWTISGGRDGVHTEHHGYLLAEMQFMQRAYPGLDW